MDLIMWLQDFFMMSAGKRKRDEFASQYPNGGYIPQQDGAGDTISNELKVSFSQSKICLEFMVCN